MKTIFSTIIFIIVCLFADAQKPKPQLAQIDNEKMNQQLDSTMKAFDSLNQKINNTYKTTMDSANRRLENVSNNKNLEEFMTEQQAKEKSGAQKRYVIGLIILGVLIYGIMRKRKKTE